jgi:16S rRNA C1402 (ribose-2'-O) methylase RsmI
MRFRLSFWARHLNTVHHVFCEDKRRSRVFNKALEAEGPGTITIRDLRHASDILLREMLSLTQGRMVVS